MKNPYKVLGVSENATDEEIKEAYKALAKKYHPDKFVDTDLADIASEKMKEVNSAYDEIQKIRSGKGSQSGNAGSNSYGPSNDSNSEYYRKVRNFINTGAIFEAEKMLGSVEPSERNAEWNFLMACVLIRKGLYADASAFLENACSMDPNNQEYRQAREFLMNQGNNFGRAYRSSGSVSACDICQGLICADCCCECLGGDLIRCC